jgi:antitoxin CptB
MTSKEILKKQIIYRSSHRGTKEMDLLLGHFVKKYIDIFDDIELSELNNMLLNEDDVIYDWYFDKKNNDKIQINSVSELLKKFKL